jgi:hypothetical protein
MNATASHGATLAWGALALCIAGFLTACRGDPDEVPEVAEVEVDRGEVKLEDKILPLSAEDIGDVILATGSVVGKPLPNECFLKTERNQVLFVEHAEPSEVRAGDTVRVTGPLAMAATTVFDGWKLDALEGKIEAAWKILPLWYLKAAQVQKMDIASS